MLTRIHLENWRSLHYVTIEDLKPMTVFIGANSSGKSNILEVLHFFRYWFRQSENEARYFWNRSGELHSLSTDPNDPIIVDLTFSADETEIGTLRIGLTSQGKAPHADTYQGSSEQRAMAEANAVQVQLWASQRWQLLLENFSAPEILPSSIGPTDLYLVEPTARNATLMLDFMKRERPDIFARLQDDLAWLLGYVDSLETIVTEQDTRILIREKPLAGKVSPTISAGTSRILAMLTAYWALDMRDAEQPGLIAIEEPDTAVHPTLLQNLVELFRVYTTREGYPRQFVLTTHNPQLLNFLDPDEVRIVERDERGETTVKEVPPHIRKIWLGEFKLGDAWLARALGGVPE